MGQALRAQGYLGQGQEQGLLPRDRPCVLKGIWSLRAVWSPELLHQLVCGDGQLQLHQLVETGGYVLSGRGRRQQGKQCKSLEEAGLLPRRKQKKRAC